MQRKDTKKQVLQKFMRLKNHKKALERQNILEICNNIVRRPLTTFAFPKKFYKFYNDSVAPTFIQNIAMSKI